MERGLSLGRMASTIDFGVAAAAVDKEIRELVESMVVARRHEEYEGYEEKEEEEEVTKMRRELVNAMRGSWENVVEIYKRDPRSHTIKIGLSGDTALHMAIISRQEDTAQKLVQLIIHTRTEKDALYVLSTPNNDGNTPLHLAAALGSVNLCKSIIIGNRYKQVLLAARNQSSRSTPLFWAAFNGNKDAFFWLYQMCDTDAQALDYSHTRDGSTALHVALENGFWGKTTTSTLFF